MAAAPATQHEVPALTHKLASLVDRLATVRGLILLALVTLAFPPLLLLASGLGGALPLDLHFAYTPEHAYQLIESYGENGRRSYAVAALTLDVAYPIAYSLLFAVALTLLLRRLPAQFGRLYRLRLLPFLVGLFDLAENVTVVALIESYPERLDAVARLASFFTSAKWTIAAVTIAVMLLAGAGIARRHR